jgi:acyl-coenzyme A synthetase/AMP-(fatty) acid ligase
LWAVGLRIYHPGALNVTTDNLAAALLDGAIARGTGERPALREGDRALSYRELRERVARTAAALAGCGVRPGDRVAVLMSDSIDAAAALLGAVWVGAVAVPVSELARGVELRAILADSGAGLILAHEPLRTVVDAVRDGLPELRAVIGATELAARVAAVTPAAAHAPNVDAIAFLLYSGGSRAEERGRRGVPLRHAGALGAATGFRGVVAIDPDDRVFSLGRLWTAYGLSTGLLFPLAAGAESFLLPAQPRSVEVLATVLHARPTIMLATPSIYGHLARDVFEHGGLGKPLAGLRACVSAAEATPVKVIERCRSVLGTDLTVGYGLTEALGFVLAGPATPRSGACGRPVPGFEARVVDERGVPVGVDEIGTLEIRGPSVARAYWRSAVDAVSVEGWFRTPDRFLVTAAGEFVHCGREDQLFKVSGKWVSPGAVEHALLAHEAVWECAVIGADDEDGFTKPIAFVVPNVGHEPDATLESELIDWVKTELSPYMYPRWIEFVDELPKGPHGKVLRYKLRERVLTSRRARRPETIAPGGGGG